MTYPFELQRFVDAEAPVYTQVMSELRSGRKISHWMWFVFPAVAQAQSHDQTLTFTGQTGLVRINELQKVNPSSDLEELPSSKA